jgi:hypothetical protein
LRAIEKLVSVRSTIDVNGNRVTGELVRRQTETPPTTPVDNVATTPERRMTRNASDLPIPDSPVPFNQREVLAAAIDPTRASTSGTDEPLDPEVTLARAHLWVTSVVQVSAAMAGRTNGAMSTAGNAELRTSVDDASRPPSPIPPSATPATQVRT